LKAFCYFYFNCTPTGHIFNSFVTYAYLNPLTNTCWRILFFAFQFLIPTGT